MASPIQVASLYGVLNLIDNMTPGLRSAQGQANTFGSRIQQAAGQVRSLGTSMTAATAPLGAGLAYGISQSNQFSRSMSNINAILGLSQDEAAALRSELLQMGGQTVAGPQAVASAYYDIVSGVADATTHMAILQAAIDTSEAGQADLTATTSALVSAMNAYGFEAEDAAFVSDLFTRTVGKGVLTMDELAAAMPQATGLAAQFGIGMEEVGGSLAYLTTQGFSASQSATFLRGMITTLLNPTAELETAITGLGFASGQALLESEGLVGAYQLLAGQGDGLAGLITNQEALTGSLVLTGDAAEGFLTDYVAGIDGATARAGAIQDQSEGWSLLRSRMGQVAITAGDQLAPVMLDLIDTKIIPMTDKLLGWAAAHPDLTQKIVLLTGGLVILGPILGAVGTAVGVVTSAMGLLLSPVGLLALGIGAIVYAAHKLYPGGLPQLFTDASETAEMLATIGLAALNAAAQTAIDILETLGVKVDEMREDFNQFISDVTSFNLEGAAQTDTGQNLMFGATVGSGFGMLFNSATGHRHGGAVTAGRDYMVGEDGPELFRPSRSGTIISNRNLAAAGGGGGDNFNFYGPIITPDPEDFMRQLEQRRRRRR